MSEGLSRSDYPLSLSAQVIDSEKEDPAKMAYAYKMTWIWAGCLSVVVFVLWPLLTLPAGVFSKSYFTFWIVLAMIWGFLAGELSVAHVKTSTLTRGSLKFRLAQNFVPFLCFFA